MAEVPEIAGQLSLFTAPVVLLFNEGKEYARFARFIRMEELKHRLGEIHMNELIETFSQRYPRFTSLSVQPYLR